MIEDVLAETKEKMAKAVTHTQDEFGGVRTGRANPQILHRIMVNYYGADTPLQQLASLSVPETRLLVVSPYDKSSIPAIEKAIRNSDLGLNPSNDGIVIRLAFPQLTEERRKEMIKLVRHRAEEGRVAVRNVRRHSIDELELYEDEGEITVDDLADGRKQVQALTDHYVHEIDSHLAKKEQELLEV